MSELGEVQFRYEKPEKEKITPKDITCVYTFRGKEYRVSYELILTWARDIGRLPTPIQEDIALWIKMLVDPD